MKQQNRLRGALRLAAIVVAILLAALVAFLGVSYTLFYSPLPVDLPCRNCTGDAQAVSVNGFDLYFRTVGEHGAEAPIIVLHGGPGMSSQTFKHGFDFLADRFQVVYYDQRGSGNSQIKPESSLYTMEQLVEELEIIRRDVLAVEQITLVGHSAGGALALRYAFAYPQHVNKLILVAALPPGGGMQSGVVMDAFYAALNVLSGNLPPANPLEADTRMAEHGYQVSIPRLYDPSHPEVIQDFGYYSFAVNRELTRSNFGGSWDAQMQGLTMPTLITYGVGDHSDFTGQPVAEQMSTLIPNAALVGFERSGHWPYLEEPARFQEVIGGWLAE